MGLSSGSNTLFMNAEDVKDRAVAVTFRPFWDKNLQRFTPIKPDPPITQTLNF